MERGSFPAFSFRFLFADSTRLDSKLSSLSSHSRTHFLSIPNSREAACLFSLFHDTTSARRAYTPWYMMTPVSTEPSRTGAFEIVKTTPQRLFIYRQLHGHVSSFEMGGGGADKRGGRIHNTDSWKNRGGGGSLQMDGGKQLRLRLEKPTTLL